MKLCNGCNKWKLVTLTKRFDTYTSCAQCIEEKYNTPSSCTLTSFFVNCCSLTRLEESLKNEKFDLYEYGRCLFYSAITGRKDLATTLLNRGINPNTTILGRSSLIEASENGEEEIVAELLKHGANMNAADFEGNTPFMFACSNGHFKIAQMLLKHDVRVNPRNKQGSTAFILACMMGRTKIVKLLLSHGADYRLTNFKKQTPLMLASFYGHVQVVKLLLAKKEIDVNAKDFHQDTALIFAAQRGQQDICKVLVKAGARAEDTNLYNNSAKSYYASAKMEFTFNDNIATLFRTVCV